MSEFIDLIMYTYKVLFLIESYNYISVTSGILFVYVFSAFALAF